MLNDKIPVTLILDNVRSGSNVGSVFRTSDAFAIEMICLCGITAVPPEREILKTALGATETVFWKHYTITEEAIQELKFNGYVVFAVEQSDSSLALDQLDQLGSESKIALIFGNEVKGVDEKLIPLLDGCIEVPQAGTKHSLNVSVCVGVVLWEFFKLFHKKREP